MIVELLRKCAEHYLKDMVQLLFIRLPQFSDDLRKSSNIKVCLIRIHYKVNHMCIYLAYNMYIWAYKHA